MGRGSTILGSLRAVVVACLCVAVAAAVQFGPYFVRMMKVYQEGPSVGAALGSLVVRGDKSQRGLTCRPPCRDGVGEGRACRPSDLSARPGSERAIFFLTDGDDNRTSEYSYRRLGGMARERRIAIYTFVLGGDVSDAKYKELEAMSLNTGGKCYRGSQDDLAGYTGIIFDETVDYTTDSNKDGISDPCSGEGRRRVDSRTLAILSALSYEDGTEVKRRSGFYGEIMGSVKERGEKYYFLDGASVESGGSDAYVRDWVVAGYVDAGVPLFAGTHFSATVYARGDDIVLAYRGTDEDPEWNNDGLGYFTNFTLEEPHAKLMALRVAWKYAASGKSVYVTGHPLGGYLAQVGAATIIFKGYYDKLRSCEYFNGMGLDYGRMSPSLPDQYQHASERELLSGWGARTGGLVLHRIFGDPVSLLGIHSGKTRLYFAADECVRHHKGIDYGAGDWALPAGALVLMVGPEPILAAKLYGIGWGGGLMTYMWSVHETDSFLYANLRS